MAVEADGVPTVAVHTQPFARLARQSARTNGTPTLRQAFVPQPVVGVPPEQLRAYIDGPDPVSKRPFIRELLEGLTGELTAEDLAGVSFERDTPRLLDPADEDSLHQLFEQNRWTDYMPVVLPTEERVQAMLRGTSRKPDEIVGQLRPANFREFWQFTVEKVAVNAVMAGARPEYFPLILAMAASGMTARSSSTTSWAAPAIVNGPIRHEIGMNSGIGAMGPYSHANTAVGRAYGLLSQNLQGGSVIGETYMGSIGNVYNYACTWAENEERSPWEPLHVQRGFKAEDSTVTLYLGGWYTISGFGTRETWQERFRRSLAACETYSPPIVLLDPIAARELVDKGFQTKQQLVEWLADNARLTAREYWDDQWVRTLIKPHAEAGVEPWASMLKAAPDEVVRKYRPEDISVVVMGGETQAAWKMVGGSLGRAKTVKVDDWR
ncbi:hypothetical protein JI739_07030 [Ramlibacter sp. AW1]|uniref:UGSC-like domain-containing protein n=1 Tax=Ramlibacter aurantiacus TaxID=2801330 RepID=A0A937D5N5_9BURK|nr:hypothetical protein [Ramlibacter aurantiacus]MBL0420098.1 hypothetical protein [Ramlibacter aurantiacus]